MEEEKIHSLPDCLLELEVIVLLPLDYVTPPDFTQEILEKEMATHSTLLAWKIPWTEEPGRLQLLGSQKVGHD